MRNFLNKLLNRSPELPTPETPPPLETKKIPITSLAKPTFSANNGMSSVWILHQAPQNPSDANLLNNVSGINAGDILTWRMGPYYNVVEKNGQLVLEKRKDQTPPK